MRTDDTRSVARFDPWSLSADHETRLTETERVHGAYYTPPSLATLLIELGWSALDGPPRRVCDPSCGAGALLIAAAERYHASGFDASDIVEQRLHGVELDPSACEVARRALRSWAIERGSSRRVRPNVSCADALDSDRPSGGLAEGFELVVGNPPFLDQLDRRSARDESAQERLRERFGSFGPYCDTAALFLLEGLCLAAQDGVVVMLQPQSFLAARDTESVRERLLDHADLVALWGTDERPFDAQVQVCAPVLRKRPRLDPGPATVRLSWGLDAVERRRSTPPNGAEGWAALLAPPGLPRVELANGPTIGSIAVASAGFRDEFYALCAAADEASPTHDGLQRLVTVGMIDPFTCNWGERQFRLAGRRWRRPVLDATALERDAPRVAGWVRRRGGPKVLVASQSRIPEAVVDEGGLDVPVTPVISLQPRDGGGVPSVWHLAAAVSAPPVAALGLARRLGTGMSSGSVRWSARDLLGFPLPDDDVAWDRGARALRRLHGAQRCESDIVEFAVQMSRAHRLGPSHDVVGWWTGEVRRRLGPLAARRRA